MDLNFLPERNRRCAGLSSWNYETCQNENEIYQSYQYLQNDEKYNQKKNNKNNNEEPFLIPIKPTFNYTGTYGFGTITFLNSTHLHYKTISNTDEKSFILDCKKNFKNKIL